MQDEVNEKTIALYIKTGKLTAQTLQKAMKTLLAQINKQIRAERQKIKLCREIADSAAVMQRDVAAQEKSHHEKEASQTRAHE